MRGKPQILCLLPCTLGLVIVAGGCLLPPPQHKAQAVPKLPSSSTPSPSIPISYTEARRPRSQESKSTGLHPLRYARSAVAGAMGSEVVHSGGCHCRRVRWQVEAPASVVAWICNCSNCSMRGNTHFVVPAAKFALQPGSDDSLATYIFGTHTAKHLFCTACGVTSFYLPRSNPDGVAVTVACVDPGTLAHVEYRKADGRNWEEWFHRSDISEFSKAKAAAAASTSE